jgi:hypothetical protein
MPPSPIPRPRAGRLVRLSARDMMVSWTAATLDARRGLPRLPLVLDQHGQLPPPEFGYARTVADAVSRGNDRRRARLTRRHADLVAEINLRALALVERHRRHPEDDAIQRNRFLAALAEWSAAVTAQRPQVEELTARGNAVLNHYWSVVCRSHPMLRRLAEHGDEWLARAADGGMVPIDISRWRPAPLDTDPVWAEPAQLLLLPAAPAAAGSGALPTALRLVTPTGPC